MKPMEGKHKLMLAQLRVPPPEVQHVTCWSVYAPNSGRLTSSALLAVSEDHTLVVHGERVTLNGAGGHASPLPVHGEF